MHDDEQRVKHMRGVDLTAIVLHHAHDRQDHKIAAIFNAALSASECNRIYRGDEGAFSGVSYLRHELSALSGQRWPDNP